jgi:hypothetical protein
MIRNARTFAATVGTLLCLVASAAAQGGAAGKGVETDAQLRVGREGVRPVSCATASVFGVAADTLFDAIPSTIPGSAGAGTDDRLKDPASEHLVGNAGGPQPSALPNAVKDAAVSSAACATLSRHDSAWRDTPEDLTRRAQQLLARNGGRHRVSLPSGQIDLAGRGHDNIPTPHVHEPRTPHPPTSPRAGTPNGYQRTPRPATHQDLDDVEDFLKAQGK